MDKNKITYSSELMQNYKQAEIMSPEGKFQALQTDKGLSLLFSLSTDGAFYVTQETAGHATGWKRTDLSSAQIKNDFPGAAGVAAKTFSVSQDAASGRLGMALVVSAPQQDHLYLCLGNSASDTSWTKSPAWTRFPFDDPHRTLAPLKIVDVFISEASDGETIVVDVLRDPASHEKLILRYYIDPNKHGGSAWQPHDVSIDLEADRYASCLGRQAKQRVDGLYTCGHLGARGELTYQPLYNVWDRSVPPSPARLQVPGGLVPDAIASCRNPDQSTDLYVAAQGGLYYFASSNQKDGAQAVQLLSDPLLTGIRKLFAHSSQGRVVVWGLNGSDQVFYVSCPVDQVASGQAWSHPLPILTEVDLISPYLNRVDDGNTFFAAAGDDLFKMIQSPGTTLWRKQQITLPPPSPQKKSQKFNSYTTRLQVTDASNQPVAGTPIRLSATTRGEFFINHLYYVLDSLPISVDTDETGAITIVECVQSLRGAHLIVADDSGNALHIDPMEKPMQKVAKLDSVSSLQGATIRSSDGGTRPLVAPGTSEDDLKKVADGTKGLAKAYSHLTSAQFASPRAVPSLGHAACAGAGDALRVDAGDLFCYLSLEAESVVQVVEDDLHNTWSLFATIAGKAFQCVLDCAEKVAGAVEWVFNAIKTAIEELIAFLRFLFGWADITRTQQVIKNLLRLYLAEQAGEIETVKGQLDTMIANAEKTVNGWAGVKNWSGLGSAASANLKASSTPVAGLDSPSTLLLHHFQGNAHNMTQLSPQGPYAPDNGLVAALMQALEQEGGVLDETLTQLSDLALQSASLSLEQILCKLIAILTDGALGSAGAVLDAVLDILHELAKTALELLEVPIYIPVISDILHDFGVPSLSMLDLFCWIVAVPVTLVFKLAKNAAPFPDGETTRFLINASSFQDVRNAFAGHGTAYAPAALQGSETIVPDRYADTVFFVLHLIAGVFGILSAGVRSMEAAQDKGGNPYSTPATVVDLIAGASDGVALTLVPEHPISDTAVYWIRRATVGARCLAKLVFNASAQAYFAAKKNFLKRLKVDDGRATGAVVDAILLIPAFFCTAWHFAELKSVKDDKSKDRAILEETATIATYLSRLGYTAAVTAENPEEKDVLIAVMAGMELGFAGCQVAEAWMRK
jgi:hypothetical protein